MKDFLREHYRDVVIAALGLVLTLLLWGEALLSGLGLAAERVAERPLAAAALAFGVVGCALLLRSGTGLRAWLRQHGYTSWFLVTLPLVTAAVALTFFTRTLHALSYWAGAGANIAVALFFHGLYDKFVCRDIDFIEEVRRGNIAAAVLYGTVFAGMVALVWAAQSL